MLVEANKINYNNINNISKLFYYIQIYSKQNYNIVYLYILKIMNISSLRWFIKINF